MPRPSPETSQKKLTSYFLYANGNKVETIRTYNGSERTWNGTNTPNYYALAQQKHGLPYRNHDVYLHRRTEHLMQRLHFYTATGNMIDLWEDKFSNMFPTSPYSDQVWSVSHSTQAYEKAKQRCITKVKDADLNVPQIVAEAQKTMNLVGDTAKTLAKSFVLFKKGKFGQGMKALGVSKNPAITSKKSLSENWLAAQYGWLPLLSDIDGACKQLAKQPRPPYFTFVGTSTENDSARTIYQSNTGCGGIDSLETGYTSTARMSLTFAVRNHTQKTMSELGINDPLLLAWELLPYSFVIDWFLPVGKYLSSINYTDGLTFIKGYTVQYSTNRWSTSTRGSLSSGGGESFRYYARKLSESDNMFLSRRALIGPPSVSLPKFKNPLSPAHMLNGLALLTKAFS